MTTKTPRIRNVSNARLLIARDVIEQIESRAIRPDTGSIFAGRLVQKIDEERHETSAQIFLSKIVKPKEECFVCAKGAVILAHVMRFNRMSVEELQGMVDATAYHKLPEFPRKMMAEIETLFEGGALFGWNAGLFSKAVEKKLIAKGRKLAPLPASERLSRIMEMLIKHKGKYVFLGGPLKKVN